MRCRKLGWVWILALCLLSFGVRAEMENDINSIDDYIQSKRVIVDTDQAQLCFVDDGDCYPVLIGRATPKGLFGLTIYTTDEPGYGGDIIGFKKENDFLFALHRVWTLIPSERRLERIASPNPADRVITNGCINVNDDVYEKLKSYFVLEVK